MKIHANFAEADIGSIRIGQAVHFTVDAFPGRHFQGEVMQVRLNPTTQQNVVTYDVVINVDNPEQTLLPGMTAYVSIAVAERKNTLLVPNAALRFKPANGGIRKPGNGHPGGVPKGGAAPKQDVFSGKVYVLEQGELVPVNISLGITDSRNTEITGGDIKAGDQVIVGEAQTASNTPAASGSPMRMRF